MQGLDQPHRIQVAEGVVTEGMYTRHGLKLPAGIGVRRLTMWPSRRRTEIRAHAGCADSR